MYFVCDGGGTKTDFLLFDRNGTVYSQARGSGTNANFVTPNEAAAIVQTGVEECLTNAHKSLDEVEAIVFFIPGFRAALDSVKRYFGRDDIVLLGDAKSAFYAALGAPYGITILSGTGSFAVGQDRSGKMVRAGGWGPLFSDEGSGYHIGVMCLSRLAWLCDTNTTGTILEKIALERLGLPDIPSIRTAAYRPDFDRKRVASLCYAVAQAAELGDENALEILDEAAESLAKLAAVVAGQLDSQGLPVALTGGVANMGTLFTERVRMALQNAVPQCTFQTARYRPVVGAALCTLCEFAGIDISNPKIGENLAKEE